MQKYLSNEWAQIYSDFVAKAVYNDEHYEAIGFSYKFSPEVSMVMSHNSSLFNLKKAAAMYFWYKRGNPCDYSIKKYFDEYKRCTDYTHMFFNSNYGFYAYTLSGLQRCIDVLLECKTSRHATLCINNNEAMGPNSIDKLCTNTLQFFIRDNKLQMIVQMRSSNFITLLPYDAFMFSVFYFQVRQALRKQYIDLGVGDITMQVASLHMYENDMRRVEETSAVELEPVCSDDNNWQIALETQLLNTLKTDKYYGKTKIRKSAGRKVTSTRHK